MNIRITIPKNREISGSGLTACEPPSGYPLEEFRVSTAIPLPVFVEERTPPKIGRPERLLKRPAADSFDDRLIDGMWHFGTF